MGVVRFLPPTDGQRHFSNGLQRQPNGWRHSKKAPQQNTEMRWGEGDHTHRHKRLHAPLGPPRKAFVTSSNGAANGRPTDRSPDPKSQPCASNRPGPQAHIRSKRPELGTQYSHPNMCSNGRPTTLFQRTPTPAQRQDVKKKFQRQPTADKSPQDADNISLLYIEGVLFNRSYGTGP